MNPFQVKISGLTCTASHLLTATWRYKKEKERAPASAKNKNPRRHVWRNKKKALAHQMVGRRAEKPACEQVVTYHACLFALLNVEIE